MESHKRIIFKVCNTYCRDSEDQKDLAQDIIVQLWKSFDQYDPQYKFTTWMYRIALNVAISSYRKTLTQKKHFDRVDFDFIQIAEEKDEAMDDNVRQLHTFIDGLDEMNKALMVLYLEGYNHQEIGEMLDISTSNVGTKISRIKGKIKSHFAKIS